MKIIILYSFLLLIFACNSDQEISTDNSEKKFAPKAFNSSVSATTATPVTLYAPIGTDKDTLKKDLVYKIIKAPKHGIIDDHCFLNTNNGSSRSCRYFSDENYEGIDTIEYQIVDKDNLTSKKAYIDIFVSKSKNSKILSRYSKGNSQTGLDIVWVLDKSESMLEKRHELQDSLVSITKYLKISKNKYLDFKMAIIDSNAYKLDSTKPFFARNSDGNIFDLTSKLAERDFQSFQDNFANAIAIASNNKSPGRIIASINKAYQSENSWFTQGSRGLVYILLSNNNEMSYKEGTFPGNKEYRDVSAWFKTLSQTKKNLDNFKVYPIVDYKVTKSKTSSDLYNRYHKLATESNGEIFDISKPLEQSLDKIGRKIASFQDLDSVWIKNFNNKKENIQVYINRKKINPKSWKLRGDKIYFSSPLKVGSYLQIQYMD